MKILGIYLLGVIMGGVASFCFLNNVDIKKYREENEKLRKDYKILEKQNDSIQLIIDRNHLVIDSLEKVDKKLDTVYIENKTKINKLKPKYEKANRVDSFGRGDILKYFTDSL
jgi:hypothetical protein